MALQLIEGRVPRCIEIKRGYKEPNQTNTSQVRCSAWKNGNSKSF